MSSPQFQRRSTQPMTPESYRRAAERLRGIADDLASCAETPVPSSAASPVLSGLLHYARHLFKRNRL